MEYGVIKVGDYIVHDMTAYAVKVTSMSAVAYGEKYGTGVDEASIEKIQNELQAYIFDCDDMHWVRESQVDIEASKRAQWLATEAKQEELPLYINDPRYCRIVEARLEANDA